MKFGKIINFTELKGKLLKLKEKKQPPKGRVFEESIKENIGFDTNKNHKK